MIIGSTTGSGFIVAVTVKDCPSQPPDVNGTTVYTTFTGALVVLVKASSAKSAAVKPFATAAPPAETVRPLNSIFVIL